MTSHQIDPGFDWMRLLVLPVVVPLIVSVLTIVPTGGRVQESIESINKKAEKVEYMASDIAVLQAELANLKEYVSKLDRGQNRNDGLLR